MPLTREEIRRIRAKRRERTFRRKRGWYGHSLAHHYASKGQKVKGRKITGSLSDNILFNLRMAQRRLTAGQIAERTGFSWQATNKHLEELRMKGLVQKIVVRSRTYWRAV